MPKQGKLINVLGDYAEKQYFSRINELHITLNYEDLETVVTKHLSY